MIKLLVFDLDGTLTNGKINYTSSGEEFKSFDVKDGFAIASWIRLKREVVIITGRNSTINQKRADELGIKYLFQGIKNKKEKLDQLLLELNIKQDEVAVIGDDLNDLSMLQAVTYSFAPNDAVLEVKQRVNRVLSKNGGEGAAREMIEIILKDEDCYDEFLSPWL